MGAAVTSSVTFKVEAEPAEVPTDTSSITLNCGICAQEKATRDCHQCGTHMCDACDQQLHSMGALKKHHVGVYRAYRLAATNDGTEVSNIELGDAAAATEDAAKAEPDEHGEEDIERLTLTGKDKICAVVVTFLAFMVVIIMCIWSSEGLMEPHKVVHVINTNTRPGHMHAIIYTTPVDIVLHGTEKEYFEVRLIAMQMKDFNVSDHRRLEAVRQPRGRALSAANSSISGKMTYTMFSDRKQFFQKTLTLWNNDEYEEFNGINVKELNADGGKEYRMNVKCDRSDHKECGFALQVVRMNSIGASREIIGIVIFLICFAAILSEKIHRVYSAMCGATAGLCAVTAIQETLHLSSVTHMIDFGTLMLLFSMMILMKMLQETGFFNWFAIKTVKISRQNPKVLFFMLTNLCGYLSMWLDNVTCVMLFGPLTYSLCRQMNLNPRYMYLPMAICATIGGTGTMIGDPPNIVIGSKMEIGFAVFLKYNFPVVALLVLPVASTFLWWKLGGRVLKEGGRPVLDLEEMQKDNQITDMPKFTQLGGILGAVVLALLLAPLHKVEPAWFTVMAMFAGAILFQPHSIHHYLMAVEWDTLFFFACLFVLVESLSELGVIKMLGDAVGSLIMEFPEDQRTMFAVVMLLWVCSFGSAFLESLPFTTTIVYVLLDMRQKTTPGIDPNVLAWPLSAGACIGGIGSIMGSSANLVSMAVSNRQAENEDEKIQGSDFLMHGLPTMCVSIFIMMIWQIIIFGVLEMPAE